MPHIVDPIAWLDTLFSYLPNTQALLDYPNLEWIIAQRVCYPLSHYHVYRFSKMSFHNKFKVIAERQFSKAEQGHILLEKNQQQIVKNYSDSEYHQFADEIIRLLEVREP